MIKKIGTRNAGILAIIVASTMPVSAQDEDDGGGVLLTFGLSQELSLTENQSFAPVSRGTTLRSTTDLSFGLASQTRTSQLSLEATTSLFGVNPPGNQGLDFSASDPRFTLRYSTRAAASTFRVNLSYIEQDITFIDPLTDFLDDLGNIIITDDFVDLSGSGDRIGLNYGASLSIRDDRPFGLTFSANVSDLSFANATTPELTDSNTTTLGVEARLDINPVNQTLIGIEHETFESDIGRSENTTLYADTTFARPDGSIGFGITTTDTTVGTRYGLSFNRSFQLPGDVTMAASVGLTQPAASDDVFVTGTFTYARPLPNGSVNASLNRSFGADADGAEQVQTTLSMGAQHALTPLATLGLNADFARAELTGTSEETTVASIGATLDYQLTPDWDLLAEVSIESNDSSDSPRAERTTLSVIMEREFSIRP